MKGRPVHALDMCVYYYVYVFYTSINARLVKTVSVIQQLSALVHGTITSEQ